MLNWNPMKTRESETLTVSRNAIKSVRLEFNGLTSSNEIFAKIHFFQFSKKPPARFRIFCHKLCNHGHFSNVILVCIMFSSAMLAAEDPMDANSPRNQVLKQISFLLYNRWMLNWISFEFQFIRRFSITSITFSPRCSPLSCFSNSSLMDFSYIKVLFAGLLSIFSTYLSFACRSLPFSSSESPPDTMSASLLI